MLSNTLSQYTDRVMLNLEVQLRSVRILASLFSPLGNASKDQHSRNFNFDFDYVYTKD